MRLKMYVWEDILCDYTCGLAVALAESVEHARELLEEEIGFMPDDLLKEPRVVEEPAAFYVTGSEFSLVKG